MAGHYMDCAANTDLQASKKLVLMCIADDADKQSRIGRVGLDAIRKWSGLGRSRALEVIKDLVDEGYLVRHAAGRIGRQAEFVVFPAGCCPMHGPVAGYVPSAPASDDVDDVEHTDERGSGGPDPLGDPSTEEGPEEGPLEGPVAVGPPLERPIKRSPQPPGKPGGDDPMSRHPAGRRRPSRADGTNPRAVRAAEAAALDAELAQRSAERAAAERAARRSAIDDCGRCDHDGYLPPADGQPGALCAHDPELPARAARGAELLRTAMANRRTAR